MYLSVLIYDIQVDNVLMTTTVLIRQQIPRVTWRVNNVSVGQGTCTCGRRTPVLQVNIEKNQNNELFSILS